MLQKPSDLGSRGSARRSGKIRGGHTQPRFSVLMTRMWGVMA